MLTVHSIRPAVERSVEYFIVDEKRLVTTKQYSDFVSAQTSTAYDGLVIFGRNTPIAEGFYKEGNSMDIYTYIKQADGGDRPFTWGLLYDSFGLIYKGGLDRKKGDYVPLLKLTVFDVFYDGSKALAATGLIGTLKSSSLEGGGGDEGVSVG